MSEMLTEMVPGQEDSSDLELLQVSAFPNKSLPAAWDGKVLFSYSPVSVPWVAWLPC